MNEKCFSKTSGMECKQDGGVKFIEIIGTIGTLTNNSIKIAEEIARIFGVCSEPQDLEKNVSSLTDEAKNLLERSACLERLLENVLSLLQ